MRLLDLASGAAVHALPGHRDGVYACAWAPLHEHLLASGSRDGALLLHDVRRSGRLALLAAGDASAEERAAGEKGAVAYMARVRADMGARSGLALVEWGMADIAMASEAVRAGAGASCRRLMRSSGVGKSDA